MSKEQVSTLFDPLYSLSEDSDILARKDCSHPGVYVLFHADSQKLYVGSTGDLYVRLNQHKTKLTSGLHRNKNLQEAFDKSPNLSFSFVKTETREQALDAEQNILDDFIPEGILFNISTDARLSNKGLVQSEDMKEHLRQKAIEQFSSQEARDRHSSITKKLFENDNFRENYLEGRTKIDLEQVGEKLSESIKNKWQDPEYREKMLSDRQKRRVPVTVEGVVYSGIGEAVEATGIPKSTIVTRIKSKTKQFENYSYNTKEGE